jgi:hypothetical protein
MATKRRYVRCPVCQFEHTLKQEPELREKGKIVIPSTCLRCGWKGDTPDDGSVSRNLPLPIYPLS